MLLLPLWLLCAPLSAATIEGRVVLGAEPLAGIRVEAHRGLDFSGEAVALSAPTGEDGLFRLDLVAGQYALFARDEERGLFAFCGRNPVAAGEEAVWAGLQAVPASPAATFPYDDEYTAAVEGRVTFEGKPLAGAYVYLYLDVADDLKGQGYRLSLPTGPDGSFAFDALPESRYYLVARRRADGGRVGPVLAGDYLGIYSGNPLSAQAGKTIRVQLATVRKVKESAGSETFVRKAGMAVQGTVTDRDGRPVAGVHVFAYTDRVIGHQRPAALSTPTGVDGAFNLYLKEPGIYYLGARQLYGDSPAPGELFGMYEATADHGLEIAAGQKVEGVKIVIEPIDLN
jgi:hypothetical protein